MTSSRTINVMYECGDCQELHAHHHQAEECCAPEVNTVYVCPVCADPHDTRKEAAECLASHVDVPDRADEHCPNCLREAETAQSRVEIAIAGHCSTCNPIYTTEQNLTILDVLHPAQ